VSLELVFAAGAAGTTALAWLAHRERQTIRGRRRAILDPIVPLFDAPLLTTDGAGIPSLEGRYQGLDLKLNLIPDTMTIKRLPQLWLSVTTIQPLPIADAGIAILIRPSGADFYSLTEKMAERFDPPSRLPWESLVRGETGKSAGTLALLAPEAARILADPKVKEIAVTKRGARIVYQLSEGKRGQHLLLRQCDFEGAQLSPGLLEAIVKDLETILSVSSPLSTRRAS
jgi:hypothetical protein